MQPTTLTLHSDFQIAPVDPRIFGGFAEHLGRCVYEGLYDPECECSDEDGFRTDVMEALRQLAMPVIRYPGGNFVSGYHWLDGVGPKEKRPRVKEMAWKSVETNQFGTDEFIKYCRKADWEPMLAVNLGTGTPEEACNWVEYCNSPAGTKYADMRIANGSPEPHNVKLWCLGNEMDGAWQTGHVPAEQYAIRAQQAAKMMKDIDPNIELIACGSCSPGMSTYMDWDRKVLEYVGDFAEYISLHHYLNNRADDTADFLATSKCIDQQIEEMDAACRFVQARHRSTKRTFLCFDEWNIWYKDTDGNGQGKVAPHLLEEVYNLEDALAAAGFLHSFIRHADSVKIANIAQIVNVIAPILTDGNRMLIQSIFYPFKMFSQRRDGIALQPCVKGPSYESKSYGEVKTIDASAIMGDGQLHVFLTNRSLTESAPITIDLADRNIASLVNAELLTGPDAKAANTFEQPDAVVARDSRDIKTQDGKATLTMPPLSFVAMTLRI